MRTPIRYPSGWWWERQSGAATLHPPEGTTFGHVMLQPDGCHYWCSPLLALEYGEDATSGRLRAEQFAMRAVENLLVNTKLAQQSDFAPGLLAEMVPK